MAKQSDWEKIWQAKEKVIICAIRWDKYETGNIASFAGMENARSALIRACHDLRETGWKS